MCVHACEHTHTYMHTDTHAHTHIPLSFLFPYVLGFHIYGGKAMHFLLNWPFLRVYRIPEDTHPEFISATCITKIRSLLICRAATVPADTGPGTEPTGEWAPLGSLCTCVQTISRNILCFLKSVSSESLRFQLQCLAFSSFNFFVCLFLDDLRSWIISDQIQYIVSRGPNSSED